MDEEELDIDIYGDLEEFDYKEQLNIKEAELKKLTEKICTLNEEVINSQKLSSSILKENQTIQDSFNSLLHTAKNEIKRKDQLINQLRKEKDDICFRRIKNFKIGKLPPKLEKEIQTDLTFDPWFDLNNLLNQSPSSLSYPESGNDANETYKSNPFRKNRSNRNTQPKAISIDFDNDIKYNLNKRNDDGNREKLQPSQPIISTKTQKHLEADSKNSRKRKNPEVQIDLKQCDKSINSDEQSSISRLIENIESDENFSDTERGSKRKKLKKDNKIIRKHRTCKNIIYDDDLDDDNSLLFEQSQPFPLSKDEKFISIAKNESISKNDSNKATINYKLIPIDIVTNSTKDDASLLKRSNAQEKHQKYLLTDKCNINKHEVHQATESISMNKTIQEVPKVLNTEKETSLFDIGQSPYNTAFEPEVIIKEIPLTISNTTTVPEKNEFLDAQIQSDLIEYCRQENTACSSSEVDTDSSFNKKISNKNKCQSTITNKQDRNNKSDAKLSKETQKSKSPKVSILQQLIFESGIMKYDDSNDTANRRVPIQSHNPTAIATCKNKNRKIKSTKSSDSLTKNGSNSKNTDSDKRKMRPQRTSVFDTQTKKQSNKNDSNRTNETKNIITMPCSLPIERIDLNLENTGKILESKQLQLAPRELERSIKGSDCHSIELKNKSSFETLDISLNASESLVQDVESTPSKNKKSSENEGKKRKEEKLQRSIGKKRKEGNTDDASDVYVNIQKYIDNFPNESPFKSKGFSIDGNSKMENVEEILSNGLSDKSISIITSTTPTDNKSCVSTKSSRTSKHKSINQHKITNSPVPSSSQSSVDSLAKKSSTKTVSSSESESTVSTVAIVPVNFENILTTNTQNIKYNSQKEVHGEAVNQRPSSSKSVHQESSMDIDLYVTNSSRHEVIVPLSFSDLSTPYKDSIGYRSCIDQTTLLTDTLETPHKQIITTNDLAGSMIIQNKKSNVEDNLQIHPTEAVSHTSNRVDIITAPNDIGKEVKTTNFNVQNTTSPNERKSSSNIDKAVKETNPEQNTAETNMCIKLNDLNESPKVLKCGRFTEYYVAEETEEQTTIIIHSKKKRRKR